MDEILSQLPTAVSRVIGNIQNVSFPRQGATSAVAFIETESGSYVIKISRGARYSQWLTREFTVLQALHRYSDLRVPEPMYHWEETLESSPSTWVVMNRLPGVPLREALGSERDPVRRHTLLQHIGETLSALHRTPCPNGLANREVDWLEDMLRQAKMHLTHDTVDGTAELLETLERERPRSVASALIHGDCTMDNILVSDGKVSGLIDWAGGGCGDPRYDLALATRNKPGVFGYKGDLEAFYEGYGTAPLTHEEFQYFEALYEFF